MPAWEKTRKWKLQISTLLSSTANSSYVCVPHFSNSNQFKPTAVRPICYCVIHYPSAPPFRIIVLIQMGCWQSRPLIIVVLILTWRRNISCINKQHVLTWNISDYIFLWQLSQMGGLFGHRDLKHCRYVYVNIYVGAQSLKVGQSPWPKFSWKGLDPKECSIFYTCSSLYIHKT